MIRMTLALVTVALSVSACLRPEKPALGERATAPVVGAAANEDKAGSEDDQRLVVATFSGGQITAADVKRWTDHLGQMERMRYQALDRRKELVDEIVNAELLAREALAKGYDRDEAVLTRLKVEVARRWLEDQVAARVTLRDVSDEDVARAYEQQRAAYVEPETRRLRHVRVVRPALAAQIRAEADQALRGSTALEAATEAFVKLVGRYSEDDETRVSGGFVGWIDSRGEVRGVVRQGRVCPELAAAAFALPGPGTLAGPLACPDGLYVVYVEEVRQARQQPLDEVASRVRNHLLQERRAAEKRRLLDDLRAQAGVRVDEAAVKALEPAEQDGAQAPRVRLPNVTRMSPGARPPALRPGVDERMRRLDTQTKRELLEEQAGKALK